jgi:prepilin-type N-terminal cleavage/methylation domain-containing protein/prepilin-type processing-associated H-X9-DG protein
MRIRRNKSAFTLIELLVVIAIIALLLSILMPSLSKVKQKAQGLVCKTHLKDIGLMMSFYMNDHDNRMVDNRYKDEVTGAYIGRWSTVLGKYYNRNASDAINHDRYNTDVFACPIEWKKVIKAGKAGFDAYSNLPNLGKGYGFNGFIGGTGKYGKSTQWRNTSELPVLHDTSCDGTQADVVKGNSNLMYPHSNLAEYGWQVGSGGSGPKTSIFGPAANHGRGINYLFADMHVEMTMWPYQATMDAPKDKDFYKNYWHPKGDIRLGW